MVALAAVIGTGATFIAFAGPQATAATDATAAPTTPSPSTTGNSGATDTGPTANTGNTGNTGTGSGSPQATTGTTTTTTTTSAPAPAGDSARTATPAAAGTTGDAGSASTPSAGSAAPVDPSSTVVDGTVTWTGNGTTNGQCGSEENLGVTVPAGQQAWLFILTSPGTDPFTLTTNLGDATGTQMGNGSVHFIIFTPLGATLTSASAVTGTANSVLTVSGCQFGTPLVSGSTTSTVVFDATTNAPWSGTETVGATAFDTSTVTPTTSGGPTPTGTVTYTFFTNGSCDRPGSSQTVTLNEDGTVPHSATSLPLAQGQYSYDAVYSGDPNYGASPVSSCEPFSVGRVTPTISTVVFNATTNAPLAGGELAGTTTYDTSTLAGLIIGFAPTGTVTYTFFPNGNCTAPGTTETVTIASGAVPKSPTSLPLPAGSYSYDAVYSGDDNYNASAPTVCEPFSLAPTTSGSTTNGSTTTGTGSAATNVTTSPATAGTTASGSRPAIAFTGADLAAMFAAGLILLATGSVLLLESRRRRRRA